MSSSLFEKMGVAIVERVDDADKIIDMLQDMRNIERIAVLALVLAKVAAATRHIDELGGRGPHNTVMLTAALANIIADPKSGAMEVLEMAEK